jgi:hypothetical protein
VAAYLYLIRTINNYSNTPSENPNITMLKMATLREVRLKVKELITEHDDVTAQGDYGCLTY